MKHLSTLAAGLLIGAAAFPFSNVAFGQSDGWVTLLDSTKMGDWTEVGKANWKIEDGAVVADKTEGNRLSSSAKNRTRTSRSRSSSGPRRGQ